MRREGAPLGRDGALDCARGHRPRVRESADLLVDLDCLQSGGQLLRAASRRRSLTSPVVDDCRARIPSLPTAMVLFVKVPSPRPRNIKGPSTNRFAVCGGVYSGYRYGSSSWSAS